MMGYDITVQFPNPISLLILQFVWFTVTKTQGTLARFFITQFDCDRAECFHSHSHHGYTAVHGKNVQMNAVYNGA